MVLFHHRRKRLYPSARAVSHFDSTDALKAGSNWMDGLSFAATASRVPTWSQKWVWVMQILPMELFNEIMFT